MFGEFVAIASAIDERCRYFFDVAAQRFRKEIDVCAHTSRSGEVTGATEPTLDFVQNQREGLAT